MRAKRAPRKEFLVIRDVLVNPLDNLSTKALGSSNFLTSVLANEVRRSGFKGSMRPRIQGTN